MVQEEELSAAVEKTKEVLVQKIPDQRPHLKWEGMRGLKTGGGSS